MKFVYEYRTSDNVRHEGVIAAANREAAFAALKSQGVRPGSVREAPGFFNKLFGKGKRWLAIVVLAGLSVVGWVLVMLEREPDWEDRAQIYGSPSVIRMALTNRCAAVFASAGERWLADHAIPGRQCACAGEMDESVVAEVDRVLTNPVEIKSEDLAEVAQLKRIVNGMKREALQYKRAGGTMRGYMKRVEIRQRTELSLYQRAENDLRHEENAEVWNARNAMLRKMGLPMVENEQ